MKVDGVSTRGEAREEAILGATLELLAEVGYDRMSVDAIAVRAHASKATIYRRWAGKAELVVTAVERRPGERTAEQLDTGQRSAGRSEDPGDLREDLLDTLQPMRDGLVGQDAGLLLGLMTAMHRDEELTRTVRVRMVDTKRRAFDPAIERARARGELPTTIDRELLAELCSAMLFSRAFVTGQALDDDFLAELVDHVLLPLLQHQNDRGRRAGATP